MHDATVVVGIPSRVGLFPCETSELVQVRLANVALNNAHEAIPVRP